MEKIIKEMQTASGDIWTEFKKYCFSHNYDDKDFISGLYALGSDLDDKYLESPLHILQVYMYAGFVNSLIEFMGEKK